MSTKSISFIKNTKIYSYAFIIDIIYSLIFILSIVIKCFYFHFTTKLNLRPFFKPANIYMLSGCLGAVLIILSISLLLFNKRRKTALLVANIMLSLLIFSDTIYFRYYYNAISAPVLYQLKLTTSVGGSVKTLFKAKDLVYIIDIPFMLVGILVINKFIKHTYFKMKFLKKAVLSVVIFFFSLAVFRIPFSKTDTSTFAYDNNYVIRNMGVFYFHYYDLKRFISQNLFSNKKLSDEEIYLINSFFEEKAESGKKYFGAAKGKNLIIIQVEALQNFVINAELNGNEITPNLNKYINESIYFDNFYFQVSGGNTSDAEFLCNTSLYPVSEGAVYFRFPSNTYYSLPKLLKNQGYKSYVSHANNPSFWNRTEMYKAIGFDTFFSNKDFELLEIRGWGLSDYSMFMQTLDKIDTQSPFYSFIVTLSSHHPFNFFDDYEEFDPGEFEGTFLGDYLKAAHYVDNALGKFIDELKTRGLYENSLLVIYGDHSAVQIDKIDLMEKFLGKKIDKYEWLKLQEVPCFIHFPGMKETGINSTVGGQIDIFPTVANLMGLKAHYTMGKDLLNTTNGYAVLRDNTVITDKYCYINYCKEAYNGKGELIAFEEFMDEIESLQKQLHISDTIIMKNAFKQLPDLFH